MSRPSTKTWRIKRYLAYVLYFKIVNNKGTCQTAQVEAHMMLMHRFHWRSSHYVVTHVRNKNRNIQGRSPNVVKVIFHATRNCS